MPGLLSWFFRVVISLFGLFALVVLNIHIIYITDGEPGYWIWLYIIEGLIFLWFTRYFWIALSGVLILLFGLFLVLALIASI